MNASINLQEDRCADEFPKAEPQAQPRTQRAEISLDPKDTQAAHYNPYCEEVGSDLGRRTLIDFESYGINSLAAPESLRTCMQPRLLNNIWDTICTRL